MNKTISPSDPLALLQKYYSFANFRPGQLSAVQRVIAGENTVVIMPTGGGKSLCYQIPALALPGVTLVISPLIALMKDQVDALVARNIPATYINSALSEEESKKRLAKMSEGHYKLVYIAPERFYNQDFITNLKKTKISLFAVDEAHCISQWGHDFRPSYTRLKKAVELIGSPTIIALTATATPEVREDIITQLGLVNPHCIINGFARPNLQFGVSQANETQKPFVIVDIVTRLSDQCGVIYAGTRAKADQLLEMLLSNGVEAVGYHAGLQPEERRWIQENFMSGKARVIVATNAFGMGIDKPDIRFVIHYDLPGTIEAYYQEAGRAGRDGQPSVCLLLYHPRDRYLREFFIRGDNPDPALISAVYEYLLEYKENRILLTYGEIKKALSEDSPETAIGTCLRILEQEGYIRREREKVGQAVLKLLTSVEEARDSLGSRAKKQLEVFDKLFARFEEKLKTGWAINLEEAASLLEVKKDSLTKLLKKLSAEEVIEYLPPFRGTELELLKRVEPEELNIDTTRLKNKAAKAYGKLDYMENYVYTEGCRQKYLLEYFGDYEMNRCERCDTCLKSEVFKNQAGENIEVETNKDKSNKLATKLTQLETLELVNKGLDIKQMAKARGLKEKEIINHLVFLSDKGLKPKLEHLIKPKEEKAIQTFLQREPQANIKEITEQFRGEIAEETIELIIKLKKQ